MKKYIYFIFIAILLFSCEKAFLGNDELNNPENNFELFWNDLDQQYGLFVARDWDWDSIYNTYRPQVNSQTTELELWNIFSEMIEYLDDSHTWIYNPKTDIDFSSGSIGNDLVEKEFNQNLIQSKYLENINHFAGDKNAPDDGVYIYGKIKDKDIGYIYMQYFDLDDVSTDIMDEVLLEIGKHKAIVFDIRNNGGGYDITAADIAGRFADGEQYIYSVQEKNGPNHNDFDEKIKYYTKQKGAQHFDKPIILLTDNITVSAADIFCLHMKSFSQVTQIGTHTAGDYSDISSVKFLPNGWQYGYSTMMFLMPDGTSQDGIGSIPDVIIKNTYDDINADNDKVFEKSLDYLFDTYGIE